MNEHNTDLTRQDVTATSATVTEEISALRLLVHAQQATIKKLQSQLNFVLTFLGIDDTDIPDGVDLEATSSQADAQNSKGLPAHHEASAPADKGANSDHQWSEVVKRHRHNQVDTFKQSLVTALYVDQSLKRSRENSLIVTGLVPVSTGPDTELFSNLCVAEFQMRPDIVSVKRLGQPRIGRVQPLLVHLKQTDQAKMLIDVARQLRSSSDPVVQERIFISSNLTNAEAAAAYQVRVQRLLAQQRRREGGNHSQPSTAQALRSSPVDANSASLLNPLADSFSPPVVTSLRPID